MAEEKIEQEEKVVENDTAKSKSVDKTDKAAAPKKPYVSRSKRDDDDKEDDGDDRSSNRRPSSRPQNGSRGGSYNNRYNTNSRNRNQIQTIPAYVDWKDADYLGRFIPERGKILPRRISMVTAKDQRRLARAIKRARVMALLPYVSD